MILTQKTIRWIIVIAAVIVIGLAIWYYRTKVKDPNVNNEPVPAGSPTPKWVPESFPLNVGMYGTKIKTLQQKLGISDDGKFGTQTKSAVIAKGKQVPLSEADYNSIVNPTATGGGSNFQLLKQALAGGSTNFSGGISYLISGQNKNYRFDFYTNGRFFVNTAGTNDAIKRGTYSNGGKKMVIDGGNTYENTLAVNNISAIVTDIGG